MNNFGWFMLGLNRYFMFGSHLLSVDPEFVLEVAIHCTQVGKSHYLSALNLSNFFYPISQEFF